MDSIFHEKQQGQLCAQHCINNLLQGAYFNAVELSKIATELDEAERTTLVEGAMDEASLEHIIKQPSSNMDDSGFFSGQVISKALEVWSLSMVPLSSPSMKEAMEHPTLCKAFICNQEHHWFTIRKLGRQWFNLDSMKKRPELVSDTYLRLFLAQLQLEGYTIFVIEGDLPSCEADELLTLISVPAESSTRPPPSSHASSGSSHASSGSSHASSGSSHTSSGSSHASSGSSHASSGSSHASSGSSHASSGSSHASSGTSHASSGSSHAHRGYPSPDHAHVGRSLLEQTSEALSGFFQGLKDLGGASSQEHRDKTAKDKAEEEYQMKLATALSASMAPEDTPEDTLEAQESPGSPGGCGGESPLGGGRGPEMPEGDSKTVRRSDSRDESEQQEEVEMTAAVLASLEDQDEVVTGHVHQKVAMGTEKATPTGPPPADSEGGGGASDGDGSEYQQQDEGLSLEQLREQRLKRFT